MSKMKTAVLTKRGFIIQETKVPTITEDQLLIKTHSSGVCSGDLYLYQHRETLADNNSRLGHEGCGTVVQLGRNVTQFGLGDQVASLSLPVYADYFVSTADLLAKIPTGVDPALSLGEAIACCVHAGNRFGIQPGDKVAVIGCGFMGLICLQLANHQQAGFICAIDPVAERLQMSRHFGATVTFDPTEKTAVSMLHAVGEFDVVIEAAGVQSAVDLSTKLVKEHGRIILVGYHQSNQGVRSIDMKQWNYKAIDVINGHVRRGDEKLAAMRQGLGMLANGTLQTKPLVTVFDFSEIEQAFQALAQRQSGLYKAVVQMT